MLGPIDPNLLRNRQNVGGGVALGKPDWRTDYMYAGMRQFPGQFMQQGVGIPSGLREKMLQPGYTPDVVGDRWGLQSYDQRLGWFR